MVDLDPQIDDGLDLLVHHIPWHTETWDAVAGHTAQFGQGLEYLYRMAHLTQIEGGRESGRTAADDGYPLAGIRSCLLQKGAALQVVLGGKTLQRVDGHRLIHQVATTLGFAWVGADAAADHR